MRTSVRHILIRFASLAAAVLLLPAYAFAATQSASTGTLMAAVMEQVGYHAQAQVLKQLNLHFQYLGGFVYLCIIVSMILTVALHGNYRAMLWTLVGPPLFFWASGLEIGGFKNTISGAGVEWRFGAFDDTQVANDKKKIMSRPAVGNPGEVSFLFHKYNELISEIMQKLIKVITKEDVKKQMIFMARQRTMEDLFSDKIVEAPIQALAAYFMTQCSVEITYARLLALGNRDPGFRNDPEYKMAETEYCRLFPLHDKPFEPGPWQDYVYDAKLWQGTNVTPDEHARFEKRDWGQVSCAQMWGWLRVAARSSIFKTQEQAAALNLDSNAWRIFGTLLWNDVCAQYGCN